MSKLVGTYFRLPEDELLLTRQLAMHAGKSLADYIRTILRQYNQQTVVTGKVDIRKIKPQLKKAKEPIWSLKPFASGVADAASNHDKYLY